MVKDLSQGFTRLHKASQDYHKTITRLHKTIVSLSNCCCERCCERCAKDVVKNNED